MNTSFRFPLSVAFMKPLLTAATTIAISLSLHVHAAEPAMAIANSAENVGLSTERLKRIAIALQAGVDKGEIPGAVVLIARKGKIAYFDSVGYRDREAKAPMTRDTIFRISSMTKPIVSVAAMVLVEEGKLSLPAPVSQYLPEFKGIKVGVERKDEAGKMQLVLEDAAREMTVYDLLRHTSGLTYGFMGSSMVKSLYNEAKVLDPNQTTAEMVSKLAKIPLQYQPGTTWDYGMSHDVLGRVVEVVSGMALDQFIAQRVTGPLKMPDTGFWVEPSKQGRFAVSQNDPTTGKRPPSPDFTRKPNYLNGGFGMVSTAADFARFSQFLLNKGELDGARLLSRTSVEYMTADHVQPGTRVNSHGAAVLETNADKGQSYGLGVSVRVSTGRSPIPGSVGSIGWTGAAGTIFTADPKEEMSVIFMHQNVVASSRFAYWYMMRALAYQAIVD